MNDQEQIQAWINQAFIQSGFEKAPAGEIYFKERESDKLVVDLTAGTSVYFKVGKQRVDTDDEAGTLSKTRQMIEDAKDGIMPSKSEPDIVYTHEHTDDPQEPENNDVIPDEQQDQDKSQETEPVENIIASGILSLLEKYVGNDVVQIFGDTGSGKSKFCLQAAKEAIAAGKKVYYLDTERNLTDDDIKTLTGCEYKYTPVLSEIDSIVQNLPPVDLVILDSIGFPVLTTYARLSMKQKGDALLTLIAIFGDLKQWAYRNNGIAIVSNQPESEFNKEKGHVFRPFGDKSQFAAKEIWKTTIETRNPTQTKIKVTAFRSRSVGMGANIASMKIDSNGVDVHS